MPGRLHDACWEGWPNPKPPSLASWKGCDLLAQCISHSTEISRCTVQAEAASPQLLLCGSVSTFTDAVIAPDLAGQVQYQLGSSWLGLEAMRC